MTMNDTPDNDTLIVCLQIKNVSQQAESKAILDKIMSKADSIMTVHPEAKTILMDTAGGSTAFRVDSASPERK